MTLEEIRKKDKTELQKMVQESKKKIHEIRFKRASNQLKDVNEMAGLRKEIAQMLTVINETK